MMAIATYASITLKINVATHEKIATYTDTQRKEVLYFAINQSNIAKPFVLGGYTNDPNLPPIAQTGGARSFGLSELDSAVGPGGLSWRDFLSKIGIFPLSVALRGQNQSKLQFFS